MIVYVHGDGSKCSERFDAQGNGKFKPCKMTALRGKCWYHALRIDINSLVDAKVTAK